MNTASRSLSLLSAVLIPIAASGQSPATTDGRWALGAGAALIDSPYAGEGTRVRPFPLIDYAGERFFLRGISGGVHMMQRGPLTLDAFVGVRIDGFDIDDLDADALRTNGLSPDLLEDRDDGIDAGVRAVWRAGANSVTVELTRDVADVSDGTEFSVDYGHSWQFGATRVAATAGVSWLSDDLARYYYGTLDEEVARGIAAYDPGSVLTPRVGFSVSRPLGGSWQLLLSGEYLRLPSELRDSPLLEPDANGMARVVIGVSRRF